MNPDIEDELKKIEEEKQKADKRLKIITLSLHCVWLTMNKTN